MTDAGQHRRLTTILIADIVGYSRLIGTDEAGTLAAIKLRRKEILEPLVHSYGGRVVKFLGDGVLVEFSSAVNAVICGLTLQKRMVEANASLPEHQYIVLRIGINIGDIVLEGADIFGDGVNIAARLEPLAKPGELCIAANAYDVIRSKLDLSVEDLGELELKNIARPVRAFRVSGDGVPSQVPAGGIQTENLLSIAVLAFDNMSGASEYDYIGEGIAESIITELARFHDLNVIARNSSFAYKGKATRVQDIRRDLGVNYVIEGSIQKAGDRIRASAQLIEGATGKHLWAERYDRRSDDIFMVLDEISELIVGALATTYGGRLRKAANEVSPVLQSSPSLAAMEYFVSGMQELSKVAKQPVASCIALFEKSIAINRDLPKPMQSWRMRT